MRENVTELHNIVTRNQLHCINVTRNFYSATQSYSNLLTFIQIHFYSELSELRSQMISLNIVRHSFTNATRTQQELGFQGYFRVIISPENRRVRCSRYLSTRIASDTFQNGFSQNLLFIY